jgi:large subunit ribosomal protein L21
MYAIVQVGGRQYRATAGDRLVVDRLDVEPGTLLQLQDVRMLVAEEGDKGQTRVGRPSLDDVLVEATAVSHFRGPKMLVFKYKPKKRYRRQRGFRAELTELRIEEVGNEMSGPSSGRRVAGSTVTRKAPAAPAPADRPSRARAGASVGTATEVKPKRASRAKTVDSKAVREPKASLEQETAEAPTTPNAKPATKPAAKPAAATRPATAAKPVSKPAATRPRAKAADSEPVEPKGTVDGS